MSTDYDRVIGVNDAVSDYACDWWAVIDWHVYRRVLDEQGGPVGTPSIYGTRGFLSKLAGHSTHPFDRRWACEDMRSPGGIGSTEFAFHTATAALALAFHLDATAIDAFGVDMAGGLNHLGAECPQRKPNRWRNEIMLWDKLVAALKSEGVTVNRLRPVETGYRRKLEANA
tara:strand:- start:2347 stop:2859 length:513 start_codon:yes stop_codon:yes gene_type:complete